MSAPRAFHDAIQAARRTRAADAAAETDTPCCECQGTGLQDGPDGPPCEYCSGLGIW